MKTLFLVRHAKSSWKYPHLDDFERPLNKRGRDNAPLMGRVLKKRKVAPDLVISSPANRAAATARLLAAAVDYPPEKIQFTAALYEFDENALIDIVKHIDDGVEAVMVVGHNPAITGMANFIADQPVGNIPTCGIFAVELEVLSWADVSAHRGKCKFFEYPRKHQ